MSKRILLSSAIILAGAAAVATVALAQAPAGAGGGRGGAPGGAGGGPGAGGGRGATGPTAPAPGVAPAMPGVVRAEFPPVTPGVPAGYENITPIGPLPDQGHIPFVLPKDIPWSGREGGEQTYDILGHQGSPGPYMQLLRWWPDNGGQFSSPHYHAKERYIVVLSGTWWTSAAAVQDKNQTYPLPAGTVVRDTACTIHWDGTRATEKGPVTLLIYGEGPSGNVGVDASGSPTRAPDPNDAEAVKCAANAKATAVGTGPVVPAPAGGGRGAGGGPGAGAGAPAAGGGRGGGRGGQ